MKNIDVFHDPGLGRLQYLYDAFPKLAAFADGMPLTEDGAQLPDTAFADPANRLFPIHTAKMAAVSNAYARAAMHEGVQIPAPVVATLKTAAEAYGLDAHGVFVTELPATKTASDDPDDYLFPETRRYPIRDADEVKVAELRLVAQRSKLATLNRVQAFVRLYNKAAALGVELSPTTYKYAGLTETDRNTLRDALRARSVVAEDGETKTAFLRLADAVHADRDGLRTREQRVKLADAVRRLDERSGVVRHYDRGILDPMETVFNTTKVAGHGIELGDDTVSMTKLMSLHPSFFGDVLGDDFIPDITTGGQLDSAKLAEVLPTLPRDMKQTLARALKGA
jgi:hypothetical protein